MNTKSQGDSDSASAVPERGAPPEDERDWRYIRCRRGHKALLAWDVKTSRPMAICELCREGVYADKLRTGEWEWEG
jgi:hypothetical protein